MKTPLFCTLAAVCALASAKEPIDYIDPLIGTEGKGSQYGGMMPMTGVPFGSIQWVPMTRLTVGATEGAYGTVFTTTNLTLAAGATLALTVDDSGMDGDLLMVEGDLACEGALTVDFGRTAADPLTYGMKIPLAEVTGEVTAPTKVSAENSGLDPVALSASVEDGVLYVSLKTGDTLLIFR